MKDEEYRKGCETLGEILSLDPAVIQNLADSSSIKELLATIVYLLSEIKEGLEP